MFSKPDNLELTITPLGAAIVEALPNRKMVRKIERDFKQLNVCPMSELFDHAAVRAFYRGQITPMPRTGSGGPSTDRGRRCLGWGV